jgi:hypothetical protein
VSTVLSRPTYSAPSFRCYIQQKYLAILSLAQLQSRQCCKTHRRIELRAARGGASTPRALSTTEKKLQTLYSPSITRGSERTPQMGQLLNYLPRTRILYQRSYHPPFAAPPQASETSFPRYEHPLNPRQWGVSLYAPANFPNSPRGRKFRNALRRRHLAASDSPSVPQLRAERRSAACG